MRGVLIVLLLGLLTGCAVAPQAPEPREMTLQAATGDTPREGGGLVQEEGYVIRHADAELGRVEAVMARWPGYRILAIAFADDYGTRLSLTATRGGSPLPPHLLDPLLAELQRRLGLAPR